MDAGIEVKVEDYDGTYVCLFCGESVRGQPALKCSHCSSNPFHLCLLYTSPSPRDGLLSRMPSSA